MSLSDHRPPRPTPTVAGTVALIVIGLLIFVPSGLCTGVMALGPLIESMLHPQAYENPLNAIFFALMFGGPFLLIGGAMLWRGISHWRAIMRERSTTKRQ